MSLDTDRGDTPLREGGPCVWSEPVLIFEVRVSVERFGSAHTVRTTDLGFNLNLKGPRLSLLNLRRRTLELLASLDVLRRDVGAPAMNELLAHGTAWPMLSPGLRHGRDALV